MKHFFLLWILLGNFSLSGLEVGVGFGWNSIDENFKSNLITNENKSGKDRYETCKNKFVPFISISQQFCLSNGWTSSISAEWRYLSYNTPNVNSSRGQTLPNATFSSINIFGPEVIRDFTSKTDLHSEVLLLGSFGKKFCNGSVYFGLGPVLLDVSNRIYVSSVHTPSGIGDHLVSSSVKNHKLVWGGAVRVGYQYFVSANYFLNIAYTYTQTGTYHFKNSVNTAILNGFDNAGPTNLSLKRSLKFTTQEFLLSINLLF